MIWGGRRGVGKNYGDKKWIPFFCLLPRKVEGYWVWLESIEVEAKWLGDCWFFEMMGGQFTARSPRRLTEASKKRKGIEW